MAISKTSSAGATNTIRSSGFDGPAAWYGTEKDDFFEGNDADNWAYGLGGADQLNGNGGNDMLNGGAGGDRIDGGSGHDLIFGDDPTEKTVVHGADVLNGGEGDDIIYAGGGRDVLYGGGGLDLLYGGDGGDTLSLDLTVSGEFAAGEIYDGGAGYDRLLISNNPNPGPAVGQVVIDLKAGVLQTEAGTAAITGVEFVSALGSNFIIYGSDASERLSVMMSGDEFAPGAMIYGGDGKDYISGTDQMDVLDGGAGDDTVIGGHGDDIIYLSEGNDIIYGDRELSSYSAGDTVVIVGNESDYGVQDLGMGSYIVTNLKTGDVSQLYNIDYIEYENPLMG